MNGNKVRQKAKDVSNLTELLPVFLLLVYPLDVFNMVEVITFSVL